MSWVPTEYIIVKNWSYQNDIILIILINILGIVSKSRIVKLGDDSLRIRLVYDKCHSYDFNVYTNDKFFMKESY